MSSEEQNYITLMNVRRLVDFENAEIIPGCTLRRATYAEMDRISRTFSKLFAGGYPMKSTWEQAWTADGTHTELLPKDLWRYFVIEYTADASTITQLILACFMSYVEIVAGPLIQKKALVLFGGANKYHRFIEENLRGPDSGFSDVSREDVKEIEGVWRDLNDHDHSIISLNQTIDELQELKQLSSHSRLRFLGEFAVLEALLTHIPKPTDPYDSITRQIKKKIGLLNRRFLHPLDYTPFGNASPETVWSRLYKYRSIIAHGGSPEFRSGDLAILKSHKLAFSLLHSAVRAVARQALKEPQLVADLRDC